MKIRAFKEADLPAVADLYARVARGEQRAAPGLTRALGSLLLEKTASEDDLPSLVAEDGAIAGFIGVHVRHFSFDGAPIRVAVSAQLVTDPERRRSAPGLQLLRRFLEGPQDLSVADGATATVHRLWEALGGETYHLACTRWTRLLSPFRFLGRTLGRRGGALGRLAKGASGLWAALDLAGRRLPMARATTPEGYVEPVPLTPDAFVAGLPSLTRHQMLRPQYDAPFARWLFGALADAGARARGDLHALAVPGDRGPRGWFVYYLGADRVASAVQVIAARGHVDTVFDHLVEHARRLGASAVQGRLEPLLLPAVARHRSILQYPDAFVLVHARRREITHAIQSGRASFTRLDGEYWMTPHLERHD